MVQGPRVGGDETGVPETMKFVGKGVGGGTKALVGLAVGLFVGLGVGSGVGGGTNSSTGGFVGGGRIELHVVGTRPEPPLELLGAFEEPTFELLTPFELLMPFEPLVLLSFEPTRPYLGAFVPLEYLEPVRPYLALGAFVVPPATPIEPL